MKTLVYLIHSKKMNRVFGHFPERPGVKQIILVENGCVGKYLINDVREVPPHKKTKSILRNVMREELNKIKPDIIIQPTTRDITRHYSKAKKVFISHGITPECYADHINGSERNFDLFCVGNEKCFTIPESKLLRNSIPQFDILKSVDKKQTKFNKTIIYATSLMTKSDIPGKASPVSVFNNIINLEKIAKRKNYCIVVSIKNQNYNNEVYRLKNYKDVNMALDSKNVIVIVVGREDDSIYDYYGSADLVLVDNIISTVITEAYILGIPVARSNGFRDINDIKHIVPKNIDHLDIMGDGKAYERVFSAIMDIADKQDTTDIEPQTTKRDIANKPNVPISKPSPAETSVAGRFKCK